MSARERRDPGAVAAATAPEGVARPGLALRTVDSLRHAGFRWFFASMFAGFAAIGVQTFLAGWLTFELTGSFAALGVLSLGAGLSSLATSLPAGVLADKVRHRKRFIQSGQLAGAVAAVAMALLIVRGDLQFWHVVLGTALLSSAHALTMPARQALTPAVVGMERLTNAMALYTTGQNAAFLLMPAFAGFIIGWLGSGEGVDGAEYVYFVMAGLYVAAMFLLVPVHVAIREGAATAERPWTQLAAGMRCAANDPVMRPLLAYNAAVALFWMTYMALLPGFAKEVLDVGAGSLGLLLSAGGLGAVVGSLIIASLPSQRRGLLWLLSVVVIGVAMLAFAISTVFWVSLLIGVVVGLGQAGYLSLGSVLLQAYVDDDYRGRVLSVYLMQFGLMSLGTLAISIVASVLGAQLAVGLAAAILLAITIPLLATGSRIARLS